MRAVSEGHNRIFGRCSELRGGAPAPWVFGGEVLGGESATLFEPRKLNELGHPPPAVALSGGDLVRVRVRVSFSVSVSVSDRVRVRVRVRVRG